MPAPQPAHFVLGSSGQDIICIVKERNALTGALDAVNISTATNLKILFRTPDHQKIVKTATLTSGGTDGKMQYTTEAGFFNRKNRKLVGTWRFRPRFDLDDFVTDDEFGASHEWATFKVVD